MLGEAGCNTSHLSNALKLLIKVTKSCLALIILRLNWQWADTDPTLSVVEDCPTVVTREYTQLLKKLFILSFRSEHEAASTSGKSREAGGADLSNLSNLW